MAPMIVSPDYLIDRYGDIIMGFMGVCVVVLLSVDTVQSSQYYLIISCTMLTIVLIHVLRLKSEPSDSSKHALWRGGVYSEVYIFLVHLLSNSLIGVSLGYQGEDVLVACVESANETLTYFIFDLIPLLIHDM